MSKKRKNWLEKFREFWWHDLTSSQRHCLWGVLTATRGPDKELINSRAVKKATTARIRYLLLGEKGYEEWAYGLIQKKLTPTTRKQLRSLGYHFYHHISTATHELKSVIKRSEMEDLLQLFRVGK